MKVIQIKLPSFVQKNQKYNVMKNNRLIILTMLLVSLIFMSCEDVIDVDLETAEPRLVVDASIQWQKGTSGNDQRIKLSTSTGYFSTAIPTVSGATVYIKNSSDVAFDFIEIPGTGEYVCSTFVPVINETYTLTVIANGQTLTATETLKPVPVIDKIEQETKPGFDGEDVIEVKAYITDFAGTRDFYLTRYQSSLNAVPEFNVTDDEFFDGNQVFGLYRHEDFKPGDRLDITVSGISERYANYMEIMISMIGGGGPFAVPPATLRSNLVNQTNFDNYVFGYFSLSETDHRLYIIQ